MLTIHPQRGFLNTEFMVQESDSFDKDIKFKITLFQPFETNKIPFENRLPTHYQIDKGGFKNIKFNQAGVYLLEYEDTEDGEQSQEFIVEDAIKLGGSTFKQAYVFENTPWCFVVMKDRTYFYNRETQVQYVESFSPDKIEYVNRNHVIFSNNGESDNTVFSLIKKCPVRNYEECTFKNEHIIIIDCASEDIDENSCSYLDLTILNDENPVSIKIDYDKYKIDQNKNLLYISINDIITIYNLDTINIIDTWKPKGNVICFIEGGYVVVKEDKNVPYCLNVYGIDTQSIQFIIRQPKPIISILDNNFIESENVYEAFKQNEDIAQFVVAKMTLTSISDVVISQGYLYYIVSQDIYSMDISGKVEYDYSYSLWNEENENIAPIEDGYKIYKYSDKAFIANEEETILIDGDQINTVSFKFHPSLHGYALSMRNSNGYESLMLEASSGDYYCYKKDKYDWSEFYKYGIITTSNGGIFYISGNNWIKKVYSTTSGLSIFQDGDGHIKYGKYLLAHGNVRLVDKIITFPEKWNSVSENCNFVIGIIGSRIYLYTNVTESRISYKRQEILSDIFDSSSYGRVLLSADGENILYQDKDKNIVLLNPSTGETEHFENTHFITHVNGNRPIFKVEDSHRRARLIDPISNAEINQDYIVNYTFVSPEGRFYASTKLSDYTKFYNKLTKKEISREEYNRLKDKYAYDCRDIDGMKQKREALIRSNKAYFRSLKDFKEKSEIYSLNFIDTFLEVRGFAKIFETSTDKLVADIPLGPELWFLNYVSFSYDSRYVAIAGRYPDSSKYGGLFLVFDIQEKKTVINETGGYAIWRTAFTKDNKVAAYSSSPTTYIINLNNSILDSEEKIKQIKGKSFLSFSPDGKYIALSKQGYIRYNDELSSWGHRPSTEVFIYSADGLEQLVSYNDLANVCVEDSFIAKSASAVSFSCNNTKLMMVGADGTVVIRNLHLS